MLPLKTAVLNWAIDHRDEGFKAENIMEGLKPMYGMEKQCSMKRIESYCQDFMMNGFFTAKQIEITDRGETKITYWITQYAIDRGTRFIPERNKKYRQQR